MKDQETTTYLKVLRKAFDYQTKEFLKEVGYTIRSHSVLYRVEKGMENIGRMKMQRISSILEVPEEMLFENKRPRRVEIKKVKKAIRDALIELYFQDKVKKKGK